MTSHATPFKLPNPANAPIGFVNSMPTRIRIWPKILRYDLQSQARWVDYVTKPGVDHQTRDALEKIGVFEVLHEPKTMASNWNTTSAGCLAYTIVNSKCLTREERDRLVNILNDACKLFKQKKSKQAIEADLEILSNVSNISADDAKMKPLEFNKFEDTVQMLVSSKVEEAFIESLAPTMSTKVVTAADMVNVVRYLASGGDHLLSKEDVKDTWMDLDRKPEEWAELQKKIAARTESLCIASSSSGSSSSSTSGSISETKVSLCDEEKWLHEWCTSEIDSTWEKPMREFLRKRGKNAELRSQHQLSSMVDVERFTSAEALRNALRAIFRPANRVRIEDMNLGSIAQQASAKLMLGQENEVGERISKGYHSALELVDKSSKDKKDGIGPGRRLYTCTHTDCKQREEFGQSKFPFCPACGTKYCSDKCAKLDVTTHRVYCKRWRKWYATCKTCTKCLASLLSTPADFTACSECTQRKADKVD